MKLIASIFALFLLFGGVYDSYTSWKNPESVPMTVSEYVASDKSHKYVTLTDAEINLFAAVGVISSSGKKVSRLYIPIESEEFAQDEKVSLLLNTVDKDLLATANEFHGLPAAEQLSYFAKNSEKVIRQEALSGRVMTSHGLSGGRAKEIRSLVDNLTDDFSLINHGSGPSLTRGLTITGSAVLLLLLSLKSKKKKKKAKKNAQEEPVNSDKQAINPV